ncbi:MAG: alpha/beta fold hydrolase [Acidimicrobiales bacterium]
MAPEYLEVAVTGGTLTVARFGSGPTTVLGLHGITGSSMQLAPVARHLGDDFTLLAPDLRGRGASNALPGPYGMQAHAADCAAVLGRFASEPVVVLGESMGAYVAVVLAAEHPELVARLVLADGGLPLPIPEGIDPDALLAAVLGPALARLSQVFASRPDYLDFWRAHPAVGEDWNDDVEVYLNYDLEPVQGGLQARANEEAVRVDGSQHVTDPTLIADSLAMVRCPIDLLRAARNLLNEPVPAFPDDEVHKWKVIVPDLTDAMVDDTNHYSLMLGDRGSRRIAELCRARPEKSSAG